MLGKRGYLEDNSQQFVVGPEFCGGALSKGGNAEAAKSDSVGGLIQSKDTKITINIVRIDCAEYPTFQFI